MTTHIGAPPRIRPGWVWAIFLYWVLTAANTVPVRLLLSFDMLKLPDQQLAIIRDQSVGSKLLSFVIVAVFLAAATMLWLLRRQAFPLFVIATALSVGSALWQLLFGGPLDQLVKQSTLMLIVVLSAFLVGWVFMIAMCMYTLSLRQRGVLQ